MKAQRTLAAPRQLQTHPGLARIDGGCVITRTGIRIGSAYLGRPPQPSADAEAIQHALLVRHRRVPAWLARLAATLGRAVR